MKQHIITLFWAALSLLAITSCEKLDLEEDVPACVRRKIRAIERQDTWDPPAQVYRMEVDGKTYYGFSADCCDQFSNLYDEDCKYVCAPSGGFSGQGDGQCPAWTGTPTYTLIWEDR